MQTNNTDTTTGTEDKNLLHLIGKEPLSQEIINPQFVINEANIEWNSPIKKTNHHEGSTVDSKPEEDREILQALTLGKPEESLDQLDCILTTTNTDYDYVCEEVTNPNPLFGNDPHYGDGRKDPLSYNVVLRIFEGLASQGKAWFAALPDSRSSSYSRSAPDKKYPEDPNLQKKLVTPKDCTILLQGTQRKIPTNTHFPEEIHIFENFGIRFKTPEKEDNQEKFLDPTIPFITVFVDKESVHHTYNSKVAQLLANEAFETLVKEDPKRAQILYENGVSDLYIFRKQDEDQNYYDYECFQSDFSHDIALLLNTPARYEIAKETQIGHLEGIIRDLTASLIPELSHEIATRYQSKGVKTHCKGITFQNGEIVQMAATVETKDTCYKITIENGEPHVETISRKRTPKKARK